MAVFVDGATMYFDIALDGLLSCWCCLFSGCVYFHALGFIRAEKVCLRGKAKVVIKVYVGVVGAVFSRLCAL